MKKIFGGERGVANIVAFVLIIAITIMAFGQIWLAKTPLEQEEKEYKTMQEVRQSFTTLRSKIQNLDPGEEASISLKTATQPPHPVSWGPTQSRVEVKAARQVTSMRGTEYIDPNFSDERCVDHYVENNSPWVPTDDYTSGSYDNGSLYLSTTRGKQAWTYLKFNFGDSWDFYEESPLDYDSDREFETGKEIDRAELQFYVTNIDLDSGSSEPLDIQTPLSVETWYSENTSWDETMRWNDRLDELDRVENTDVASEGEWVSMDVTKVVSEKYENTKFRQSWTQSKWDQDGSGTPGPGRFGYDYENFDSSSDLDGFDGTLYEDGAVTGSLTSSIFDSGSRNTYWNFVDYENSGPVTVEVRASNDPGALGSWVTVTGAGANPGVRGRYIQYQLSFGGEAWFYKITLASSAFTFCLRRPSLQEGSGTSSLNNRAVMPSGDNDDIYARLNLSPRLQITYEEMGSKSYTPFMTGTMIGKNDVQRSVLELGYIKYQPVNLEYPSQHFFYEGGMVFESQRGWYDVLLAEPKKMVQVTNVTDSSADITVTRYQIEPSQVQGTAPGGSAPTTITVKRAGTRYLVGGPYTREGRTEVRIQVVSDHQFLWRDYLRERLAPELRNKLDGWDTVSFDYDTSTLSILGPEPEDPTVRDINYKERVVWLDVDVGYSRMGRS